MRKYIIMTLLLILCGAAAAPEVYAAGGRRNGTGGATELLIPVGTRGIAMGNANIATSTGIEALHWNPAGLGRTDRSLEATFSYMSYIADIGVTYGAVSANIPALGVVTLSIKSLAVGDIDVTTTQSPDGTGQKFTPSYITTGLSYARALSDRISVGITGNLINESLAQVSATGFAFNIGVLYENLASVNGLNLGVVIKNLGPQMQFEGPGLLLQANSEDLSRSPTYYQIQAASFELPSTLEFGLGYRANINEMNAFQLSTTFQNSNFSGDEYKFGAEYTFNNLLSVRGGYLYASKEQETDFIYGLTAGVGLNYDMGGSVIRVDYAYRDVKFFDANHIFALSLGF